MCLEKFCSNKAPRFPLRLKLWLILSFCANIYFWITPLQIPPLLKFMFAIQLLGGLSNSLVLALNKNQMPVYVPFDKAVEGYFSPSLIHKEFSELEKPFVRLWFLGDVFRIPLTKKKTFFLSIGDILIFISFGIAMYLVWWVL